MNPRQLDGNVRNPRSHGSMLAVQDLWLFIMQLSDRKASASAVCFRISTKHKVAAAEAGFVQPPQPFKS